MKIRAMVLSMLVLSGLGMDVVAEVRRAPAGGVDPAATARMQAEMEEQVNAANAARDTALADAKKQQAQVAEQKKQIDDLQKRNEVLRNRIAEMLDSVTKNQTSQASLNEKFQKDRERVQEMVAKFRDTVQVLKQVESERTELKASLDLRERQMSECVAKNDELLKANLEVLEKYNNKGVWQALAEREPLTQIQRAKNEAWSEEFRRKNEQGRHLTTN